MTGSEKIVLIIEVLSTGTYLEFGACDLLFL